MKRIKLARGALIALTAMLLGSCQQERQRQSDDQQRHAEQSILTDHDDMPRAEILADLRDHGSEPFIVDIDEYTEVNPNFRTVLWTGKNLQLTLMNIPAGEEIGLEVHNEIDQFLRIEGGVGTVWMGDSAETLQDLGRISDGMAVVIPAGKWHNVVNNGTEPLILYSIYAPAEHPSGAIHKTYEESRVAHEAEELKK